MLRLPLRMLLLVLVLAVVPGARGQSVRKVMIIGLDGVRADALVAANTPNCDLLIANGAFSTRCIAQDRTVSGPCWSSILTGVNRDKHGVTDNSFLGSNYEQYPHFFVRLEAACDIETASIVHWSPINLRILGDNADTWITGVTDEAATQEAASLLATDDPDVVFVHLDQVDGAGHGSGFSPTNPSYLNAISAVDAHIGTIVAAIDARPTIASEDWLIIITSDHGGTGLSHGQNISEHLETPLIVSGNAAASGTTITPDPELIDLPATVLTFLGLAIDPAWDWDGEPVGLNMAGVTSDPFECLPPPPPSMGACCLTDGTCAQMIESECDASRGTYLGDDELCAGAACPPLVQLLVEDFESLALGPNADETVPGAAVWTPEAPAGWTVDRSGVPAGGITEWRGWSFADRLWWASVEDQDRSLFTRASGTVAVADSDEWDDAAHAAGSYTTVLTTPALDLSDLQPFSVRLLMDSSWRPEGSQTAEILVSYDDAAPVVVSTWSSQPGADFKADAPNELVDLGLHNPVGAESLAVSFVLRDADNNWWWAIDNIELIGTPEAPGRTTLLSEDFESLVLGPSIHETPAADGVWTDTPPTGWDVDDSGVPSVGLADEGVAEWEGWAFADRDWWITVAGDQTRSLFTLAAGTIAVVDPDEWADRGAPDALGPYNAGLRTSPIDLTNIADDSLTVAFASSWRPEGSQRAELDAVFDNGTSTRLLTYDSSGPDFKPDAQNEAVLLSFEAPCDATSMTLRFRMRDAGNNWWWGIDNLRVEGMPLVALSCDADQSGSVDVTDLLLFLADWFAAGTSVTALLDFLSCWFPASTDGPCP